MERSFSRSFNAISPPVKPSTMEKGPVTKRLGNIFLRQRFFSLSAASALRPMVLQKGAAMTPAASSKVSPWTLRR